MQKFHLILFILLAFTSLDAKPVSEQTAKQVAINFYSTKISSQSLNTLSATISYREEAVTLNNRVLEAPAVLFYVFDISEDGFVIVSGDDDLVPVIGYSTESYFSQEQMPIQLAKLFQQYKNEIRYVLENNISANDEIKQQWTKLISNNAPAEVRSSQSVGPLLNTKWGQAPYYNALCPGGSVSGCVATAMAQVMKFWDHPKQGTGHHSYNENDYGTLSANFGATTYDWGNMPNVVNSNNTAVATLMYHCGVSVNMDYSPQVSGAFVIEESPTPQANSEYAFKNYFGYSSDLRGVKRENYTSAEWMNLMKNELDAGRPILHAGFGSGGGHAFVCDGYDNQNFFHYNWGWSGNSDGYFRNDQLNPGSLGTGGGSGGYNYGQQIIIGVQPASSSGQSLDISLYSQISVSPNPIKWGQSFTVNADIINNGTHTFYGKITAALFDENGNFIEFIQTWTESNGLMPNYHYTGGLNFTTSDIVATPGDYLIGIYVNFDNQWYAVGDGSYSNFVPISIIYENDIELYADIVPSPTTLTQDQPASFSLDIANYGSNDFNGTFSIDVHDLEGNWIKTIDEYTGMSLCSNCHYRDGLEFSTSNLDLDPGSYLLVAWEKQDGENWDLVGSSFHENPIMITVAAPQLSPDVYEDNNVLSSAYNLHLSFSNDFTTLNTTGSNIHLEDDYDFYKIALPTGYSYAITPRIHDSYNSENGQTYTNDVLFSYNTNGVWSDAFDDVINGNIEIEGGNTIYFHVAPYFQGQLGSYLLEIQIERSTATDVEDILPNSDITIFPNPTRDFINIKSENYQVENVTLFDLSGKRLMSHERSVKIDISSLPEGTYIALLQTNKGLVRKKIAKIN